MRASHPPGPEEERFFRRVVPPLFRVRLAGKKWCTGRRPAAHKTAMERPPAESIDDDDAPPVFPEDEVWLFDDYGTVDDVARKRSPAEMLEDDGKLKRSLEEAVPKKTKL